MIYFKWTSAIEIGHVEIDSQHRRLFLLGEAVVESLIDSVEHKLAATHLQTFIAYAREHFKYEEMQMNSAGYPQAERHAKYHASLLAELVMHCNKVHWGQNTDSEALTSFLWNWLILHIDLADRDMVDWIKSQGSDVEDKRNSNLQQLSGNSPASPTTV